MSLLTKKISAMDPAVTLDGNEYIVGVQAGETVRIDSDQVAELLVDRARGNANFQTGTSYTFTVDDADGSVRISNAAANTVTIPLHANVALPLDTVINVRQGGVGQTTIVATGGVTITKPSNYSLALSGQHAEVSLRQVAIDVWDANGAFVVNYEQVNGLFRKKRVISATTYTTSPDNEDGVVFIDATSNNVTITLQAAAFSGGTLCAEITFKRIDSSGNTVTIQRAGSDTIEGSTSFTLSGLGTKRIISDDVSKWYYL